MLHPSTFSIVACDLNERAWGVAVASKFLATGAVVPFAQAEAGAMATQSYANTTYGPKGLALLAEGASAQETLDRLIADDEGRVQRQVGVVDAQGRAATYTGKECFAWAGGRTGQGYACQGNILVGQVVVDVMAQAFESATGELADWLLAALLAGDRAGGDSRGKQSAALVVVRPKGGYAGFNDRYLDLRVDDDPEPVPRLAGLVKLHRLYFGKGEPGERLKIAGDLAKELQSIMARLGFYAGAIHGEYDEASRAALRAFTGKENLEDRTFLDEGAIDPPAMEYIRERFGLK
jgi:uncharacterized Ntn-hydrolase superfamily protein